MVRAVPQRQGRPNLGVIRLMMIHTPYASSP